MLGRQGVKFIITRATKGRLCSLPMRRDHVAFTGGLHSFHYKGKKSQGQGMKTLSVRLVLTDRKILIALTRWLKWRVHVWGKFKYREWGMSWGNVSSIKWTLRILCADNRKDRLFHFSNLIAVFIIVAAQWSPLSLRATGPGCKPTTKTSYSQFSFRKQRAGCPDRPSLCNLHRVNNSPRWKIVKSNVRLLKKGPRQNQGHRLGNIIRRRKKVFYIFI